MDFFTRRWDVGGWGKMTGILRDWSSMVVRGAEISVCAWVKKNLQKYCNDGSFMRGSYY